jgi:ppGpp synthetase/RelA/SpoT-type nucleotidyltranferase
MKIPASIRQLYEDQHGANLRLKPKVDERIRGLKRDSWHYESRIKQEQSFALKLESGRVNDPAGLEDFFAATLVVRNATEISQAERLVHDSFTQIKRRPRADDRTHKESSAFPFDDLRLYVRWRDDLALPATGLSGITFEVQVKTFLQHAWSIATHDLVYKSDQVSWSKQRIAYQIKAMLEHAEISIQEADNLSKSTILAKIDPITESTQEYMELLVSQWAASDLPADVRRLAENVRGVTGLIGLNAMRLGLALAAERARGKGTLITNLSPYGIVVQTLIAQHPDKFIEAVTSGRSKIHRPILVSAELDLPSGLDPARCTNAVFVGNR